MIIDNIKTFQEILDKINIGVTVLDDQDRVVVWNRFMEKYSGINAEDLIGKNVFEVFSYLPRQWMQLKLKSVRLIKNYSFVSWTQRPYLFRFAHNSMMREENIEFMHQDCTFLPVMDSDSKNVYVCITINDMTDVVASQSKLAEVKDINETLEHMTHHDGLTSLYTRMYTEEQISRAFNAAKRYDKLFSLLFFDIDKFKTVNDIHGHLAGDEVLKGVAATVGNQLRSSDVFGRYGGEEFLVLLPETAVGNALNLSRRLKDKVQSMSTRFNDTDIEITISIGVVQFRPDHNNYLQMIHEADIALYHSKTHGRNAVTHFKLTGCEMMSEGGNGRIA